MVKKQTKPNNNDYQAKDIYVLEGLEPVRRRPGMYIGSTGVDGLHHLIWEVVDNSLDEAMAGFAKNTSVILLPQNRVEVRDDGRGIPVDIHKQTKKSALETVMTTLHAGGKFGGQSYKIAGGLHGVGVSVVNALSQWLRAEVCRDGAKWVQEYQRGQPKAKVKKSGSCREAGTTVTFEPDPEIFGPDKKTVPAFDWEHIIEHLRQQAYLIAGVRIDIKDKREEDELLHKTYTLRFDGGISSYIKYLNRDFSAKHESVFYGVKESDNLFVEVALQYTDDLQSRELSFANNIFTPEGGMHLTGFRAALTRTLNDYARKNGFLKENEDNLTGDDVREGLTAVISIKLKEPQFEGQTKAKLGNPEARSAVEAVFGETFGTFLEENPADARAVIEKVFLALKARKAAKAAKETVLRKGALEGLTLPGKLADCQTRKAEEAEIFIVEGDSAGGSSKQARDRRTQAILPLRGKILNVERSRIDKMLANKEIKALIIALGAAIADEFNLEKLRYHKIIIMTDADVDGAHIRTLLLTLFYRYFKPVIENGHLYIAQPPLFRVQMGKAVQYAHTEEEKERILADFQKIKKSGIKSSEGPAEETIEEISEAIKGLTRRSTTEGVSIQRYKGLGEMNPGQLWETAMDPAVRILKQVAIEDAAEANKTFDILMGAEVAPRKLFIQTHAKAVKNLDI